MINRFGRDFLKSCVDFHGGRAGTCFRVSGAFIGDITGILLPQQKYYLFFPQNNHSTRSSLRSALRCDLAACGRGAVEVQRADLYNAETPMNKRILAVRKAMSSGVFW